MLISASTRGSHISSFSVVGGVKSLSIARECLLLGHRVSDSLENRSIGLVEPLKR
jgi:hypothetical protein